jgi:hypothetical protein
VSVRVLDPATMRDGDWPAGYEALRAYTEPFARRGAEPFIANLATRVLVVRDGDTVLPMTVNDAEYGNAWVCSPYTAYALYSKEEMHLLESRALRRGLAGLADGMGGVLKAARINRMVQVNNWMLSTNLFPRTRPFSIPAITRALTAAWPDHYICFRSINAWDGREASAAFRRAGYKLVASRQVYVHERLAETWRARSNAKHDLRLLRSSPYRVVRDAELGDADLPRMAELYAMLYLEKYSRYNPAFSAEYMRVARDAGVVRFLGLRGADGVLDGVLGLFAIDGTTTAPIVGYDTRRERRLGLYRLLMTLVFETALTEGLDVNLSSGAASFKRLRGGRPYIEYSAIYDRHLSPLRRFALSALAAPVNGIGVPLMRRLEL